MLAEYLTNNPGKIKDKKIIELGAGTGLAGVAASILGNIISAGYNINDLKNGSIKFIIFVLSGADVTLTDRHIAQKTLEENVASNKILYPHMKISTAVLEWGQNLEEFPKYTVILGADVVYIEDTFYDLIKTIKHLCQNDTEILLASKLRYSRDVKFYNLLKEDFDVKELLYDHERGIYLYSGKIKLVDGR